MTWRDFTALGRVVDPRLPTNLAIAGWTAVVALIAGGAQLAAGEPMGNALQAGLGAGFAIFVPWALSRELDPDHPLSAFVTAALATVALLMWPVPALLPFVWLLLLLRVVNRSTGLPPTLLDATGILLLGVWLSWEEQWLYGGLTAVALLLSSVLAGGRAQQRYLAAVPLIGALYLAWSLPLEASLTMPPALICLLPGGLIVAAALFLATTEATTATADATGATLNTRRVQAAQLFAALVALALPVYTAPLATLFPLWVALLGPALFRLVSLAGAGPPAD